METGFLELFMERTGFLPQDRAEVLSAWNRLGPSGRQALIAAAGEYARGDYAAPILDGLLPGIEAAFGVHRYTLWLLALICCSQAPYARTSDENLFWQTFSDIRYKVAECKEIHGVCGNFVGFWYPIFFRDAIVKLGRLEFEVCTYEGRPLHFGAYTLAPGDEAYSIHIPSSGEAFTADARLDAYRRAYDYFRCAQRGVPMICFCESWLLYPPYTAALPRGSRIREFSRDFCTIYGEETAVFDDFWRVFGTEDAAHPEAWSEDTALKRALKGHFQSGGKAGFGMGLLVFDGEKLLQAEG